MSQPHPTLTLILDIDARLDTPNMRQEIQRSYAYVGNTLVRMHEPESADKDAPFHNELHLLLKLGRRKYLYSADEDSDNLWYDFMEHWFYNAFHKLGNHMKIFNRRAREIDLPEIVFEWIDIELENGKLLVRMHTDSNSDILPNTSAWLTTMRATLNNGLLGEEVEAITMPSPDDYERQLVEGLAAKAERERIAEEERKAAEEAAAKDAAAAEQNAEESFLESPSLLEADKEAAARAAKDAEFAALREKLKNATGATKKKPKADGDFAELDTTEGDGAEDADANAPHLTLTADEVGPAPQDYIPELAFEKEVPNKSDFTHEAYIQGLDYTFLDPDFAIDYHVWRIEYLDGTARNFDSTTNTFLD